jgi:hypothetical protein
MVLCVGRWIVRLAVRNLLYRHPRESGGSAPARELVIRLARLAAVDD